MKAYIYEILKVEAAVVRLIKYIPIEERLLLKDGIWQKVGVVQDAEDEFKNRFKLLE